MSSYDPLIGGVYYYNTDGRNMIYTNHTKHDNNYHVLDMININKKKMF